MTNGDAGLTRDNAPHEGVIHRILLVDDHVFLRAGTKRILEDEPDFQIVGETGEGAEALRILETLEPEVMVLDVGLTGLGGIAVCEAARRQRPQQRIVILTGHSGEALMRAFDKLGVNGYFLKSTSAEELVRGLRAVCNGHRAFCEEAQRVIDHAPLTRDDLLTPKELEVLQALAQGLRNAEIAEQLHMAVSTVEYHIRNLFAKLSASSRTEVIVSAQRLGWLDSQEPLC